MKSPRKTCIRCGAKQQSNKKHYTCWESGICSTCFATRESYVENDTNHFIINEFNPVDLYWDKLTIRQVLFDKHRRNNNA